ncbi:hypothetical protein Droror1_Dr00008626 [Drosera rotundifolia]
MATTTMAYASPPSTILSTSHRNPSLTTFKHTTPLLGLTLATTPNLQPQQQQGRRMRFGIKCQKISGVPIEQRWMFTEEEASGVDIWNKTWYPKAVDHLVTEKPWYVVDATDKILGRLASTIAVTIRGKNLGTYTPSQDMGAFVIVVNAEKVAVSGKKRTQKLYRRHSGRPGGMKVETFNQLQQRIPERIIEHAVRGMLPKGPLGRRLFHHLKVYKGPNHPHEAQQPKDLPLRDKRIQMEK